MVRSRYFFSGPTKKFSLQIRENIERRKWGYRQKWPCTAHFFFFFFCAVLGTLPPFFSFFFPYPWLAVAFYLKFLFFFLPFFFSLCLTRHDFFLTWFLFFNELSDCFFFGCLSFICFNWLSFFNKSIWINLYKFTFSIFLLFHSQPNKNEIN